MTDGTQGQFVRPKSRLKPNQVSNKGAIEWSSVPRKGISHFHEVRLELLPTVTKQNER